MADGPVPIRLDHCVIASSDLARTDAFYRRMFRAEIDAPLENMRQYRIGTQLLSVHGPGLAEGAPAGLLARVPVSPGGSDLCFEWCGSAASLQRHMKACGVDAHVGPTARIGARGEGQSIYFRDPDGSLLEWIVYPTPAA